MVRPFCLALIALPLLLVVGCGGGGSETVKFDAPNLSDLSFSYPRGWQSEDGWVGSMGQEAIVFLSTERLHPACKIFHHANGQVTGSRCGPDQVLSRSLPPGGVLVAWTGHFLPSGGFSELPGKPSRIGDHPAKILLQRGSSDECWTSQADETLTAYIASSSAPLTGWYQMDACMRIPRLAQAKTQVEAMLRSVSFKEASSPS